MIDSHSHVADSRKVDKLILAAADVAESSENIKQAKKDTKILALVGIHPLVAEEKLEELDSLIKSNKKFIVGIGECGLDYLKDNPEQQEKIFRGQIELSLKYGLPMVIHARKAVDEVIEILNKYQNLRGVFHCYSGGKKRIKRVLALGPEWYFGIDGNLTYEEGLQQVVAEIPRDRLMAETDAPELTPEPFRGQKNKPEYVKYVYKKIAQIWGESLEKTQKAIDKNVGRLFNIRLQDNLG